MREKAVRVAAHLLEGSSADVVYESGAFSVKGLPTRSLSWADIAAAAHAGRAPGESAGLEDMQVTVSQSTFADGTHAVIIEVDPDTGAVSVLRWIVAHDCGRRRLLAQAIEDALAPPAPASPASPSPAPKSPRWHASTRGRRRGRSGRTVTHEAPELQSRR